MAKEDERFLLELKALAGDKDSQAVLESERKERLDADIKKSEDQAAKAASILQDKIFPIFEQVNTYFLRNKGEISLVKEVNYSYGSAMLHLEWDKTSDGFCGLWATSSPSRREESIFIGGGSGSRDEYNSRELFLEEGLEGIAQGFILGVISGPAHIYDTRLGGSGEMEH